MIRYHRWALAGTMVIPDKRHGNVARHPSIEARQSSENSERFALECSVRSRAECLIG
jgi:hypothetical protein